MLVGVSDQEASDAFEPIFRALAAGARVLVHCKAGKHRSRRNMQTQRSGGLGAFVAAASGVGARGEALWWRAFAAKA